MLSDGDLAEVLRAENDPRAACEQLVRAANDRGGRDNVTVVLARFEPSAGAARPPHVRRN
jgi:protein phosphatase